MIRARLRNVRFRNKLLLSFFLLALIPLSILGYYAYHVASDNVKDNAAIQGEYAVKRISERLNGLLSDAVTISRYPIGNGELESLLRKDYDRVDYPLYEKIQDQRTYSRFVNHLMNLHLNMDYFFLYPFNQPYVISFSNRSDAIIVNSSAPENEEWYERTLGQRGNWVYTGLMKANEIKGSPEVITISRAILDSKSQTPLAVAKIMIDRRTMKGILNDEERTSAFSFVILDEHANELSRSFSFTDIMLQETGVQLLAEQPQHSGRGAYMTSIHRSPDTGWTVAAVAEQSDLLGRLSSIKYGLFILMGITLLLSGYLSFIIARNLVRPIVELKNNMLRIDQGDWHPIAYGGRNDEIGQLTRHYNRMLERLEQFVQQLLTKEREKKDLEHRALQSQINPHFIYNTLNSVKWCAYLEQTDNVTEMIDALVHLLRYVSKGRNDSLALKDELEILKQYIHIMSIRYDNQFETSWQVDDEALACVVPAMLLQPLIENAILQRLVRGEGDCAAD
ncbi:histidine kinase [Paenibacillus sp. J5C_2022]|uniref:sensor histidine kinase n=1 Tax=Paenibacillus sp. J5C2022 TaxID=2977129 RepID=UPI0021CE23F2|nr:histidine kinase [Paenibacillus sp. J5C2022]MCU6708737.1 histidine kinase [Paenibacillus sp. J5C2022]